MSPRRLAVAVFLLLALWVHPTQPAVTKVKGTSKDATVTPRVTHSLSPFAPSRRPDAHRLNPPARPHAAVVLESIYPDVGTAHTFTTVDLHGNGLEQKLPTLGCRFGEHVTTPKERAAASVACATPSAGPGFVVVGFARATGKTYAPGRDDITQEQGYNVFEYVEPWRVFTTFPEETSSNVGQKVFLAGRNVRPDLRCNYLGSRSTPLHFVSSALAVCESEPRASRSTGVLMLQHGSHAAPEGQQLTVRRRATPTISYSGRSSVSLGESLSLSSSTADEGGSTILSWEARIGCQFGGVWVEASARTAAGEIGCEVPASANGRTQVTVSDLHSLTPLPLDTRARAAMDAPNSGRMALTVREAMRVETITPFAGTPITRNNARGVDVFGRHLVPESSALQSLCGGLAVDPRWFVRSVGRLDERVRLRCWVALSSGGSSDSTRGSRFGFNAVTIASGPGDGPTPGLQFALQVPPRIFGTTATTTREGDVLVVVGENFMESVMSTWCTTGSSMERAQVVSSAIARCVVSLGDPTQESTLSRSSHAGKLRVGVSSGEDSPTASNLVTISWVSRSPDVAVVTPDVGFAEGGARVVVTPDKGGLGTVRFHSSVACRFGAVAPVAAASVDADAIVCTTPAMAPGFATVGAPSVGLFEDAVRYRVVESAAVSITAATPAIAAHGGVVRFSAEVSALGNRVFLGCASPSTRGDPAPAHFGPGRQWACSMPAARPGFTTIDVATTTAGAPFARGGEMQVVRATPSVSVQRPGHAGETYPGDTVFVISKSGGLDGDVWCVLGVHGDESKVKATTVSSAVAVCEAPAPSSLEEDALVDATLSVCGAHACGFPTAASEPSSDGVHVVLGADKEVFDVVPSSGWTGGGTPIRVRYAGPSVDASVRFSVCHVGTIGPVSASTVSIGETVVLECVSPARAPGVVTVAVARGKGLSGDLTFAFVDAEDADEDAAASNVRPPDAIVVARTGIECEDTPFGDVVAIAPSRGTAEGGTELELVVGSLPPRPSDACAMHFAACRFGTTWPVLGHISQRGVACVAPAHEPGTVEVSAPMIVIGSGRAFEYRSPSLLGEEPDAIVVFDAPTQVASNPKVSLTGAAIDIIANVGSGYAGATCVFASPVRASTPWLFAAAGYAVSSAVVRCEVPAVDASGVSVVPRSQLEFLASTPMSFSAHRKVSECDVSDLSPAAGVAEGGVVAKVSASCLARDSLTSIDARAGCRFGTVGPVAASMGFDGETPVLQCVTPAHAPGETPFALTVNWRDASFETHAPGTAARFTYSAAKMDGSTSDEAVPAMHQTRHAQPLVSSVVPWLVWGGSVLHVTGRDLPAGDDARCIVGSSLVAGASVSSALVLCDPFPVVSSSTTNHLAGGVREVSTNVAFASTTPPSREDGLLSVFVVDRAPVVGVDVKNGWVQGGGRVSVELGTWAPTGMMDCHFGTVVVHGRGVEGAGWQSRAAAGKAGEWWSEATATTDVECVTPAHQSGRVPVGVSLAHSTSASYGDGVGYLYL